MRKVLFCLIAVLIGIGSLSGVGAADTEYSFLSIYVENGAENGDGRFESPFGNIREARDYIRELKDKDAYPDGGVVVYFREGIYYIDESVKFTSEDSGTSSGPVVYRSYLEEQVNFVGGVEISLSSFTPIDDPDILKRLPSGMQKNIVQLNLAGLGITNYGEMNVYGHGLNYYTLPGTNVSGIPSEPAPELFFNDNLMTISRYPNEGYLNIDSVVSPGDAVEYWTDMNKNAAEYVPFEQREYPPKPSVFITDANTKQRMQNWKNASDVWVYGYFKEDWSDISLPIESIDFDAGKVTTKFPSPKEMQAKRNYYFYNLLEEIDVPGEYYIDRESGILYFYPPQSQGNVILSLLSDPIIVASGASNIHFKGIAFRAGRSDAISINNGNNISIELCSISKFSKKAISFINSRNCSAVSCHIYDTGTGGVDISYSGDMLKQIKSTLEPLGMLVENCEIHNFSRIAQTYSPAVAVNGNATVVKNNKIYNSPHMGMTLGGNDCIIENNEFFDLLQTADDSGAIYAGYGKETRGNKIINNYFRDCVSTSTGNEGIYAVYMDDTKDGCTVENNLFVNFKGTAFYVNGGRDNSFNNNIVINGTSLFRLTACAKSPTRSLTNYSLSRYTFPEYLDNENYKKYPNFVTLLEDDWQAPKYNVMKNNVAINCTGDYYFANYSGTTTDTIAANNSLEASYRTNEDIGFVSAENGNYTLRDDSAVYGKLGGFVAPDFENMGMYTQHLYERMKGHLALLVGSPKGYDEFSPFILDRTAHEVSPISMDGQVFIPLRAIADWFAVAVEYDEGTANVTVEGEAVLAVSLADMGCTLDGQSFTPAHSPITVGGRLYVTQDVIEKAFKTGVVIYRDSLVIFGESPELFCDEKELDIKLMDELVRRLSNR